MKRILSLFVVLAMLTTMCTPAFAKKSVSAHLQAAETFVNIIDELPDLEDGYGDQYVYMIDINDDSLDEMIVLYTDKTQMSTFYCDIYSYTSDKSYDRIKFREVCYFFSGNYLTEKVEMFKNGNSLILKTTGNPNTLSAADFVLAETVDYLKITINDDGSFKTINESYNDTDGEEHFNGEIKYIKESPASEKKALQSKYEKGKSELLYEFYNGATQLRVADRAQQRGAARKNLVNTIKSLQEEQYAEFDDAFGKLSDKDKLKIQNMLNGFNVGDEPVKIDNMNEQQLIELMEYALLRNQNIKPLERYWMGGGGWDMYAPDDFEKLIYDYTGINIDVTGHRCSDDFCIADYNSEKIQAIGEADSEYRKMIKKIDNHEYAVLGRSEFIYYRIPVIKNIYMLDSSTALVIYESCKISPEDDIYNSKQLLTSWDEIEGHDYGRYDLEDSFTTYAIVGIRKQGKDNSYYMIEQGGKNLISAEQAKKYIKVSTDDTNITPDYKKVRTFKRADEFISYLRTLIDGKTPNDSAKAEIVKYMEYAIEKISDCVIKAKSGKVTVDVGTVESVIAQAKKLKNDFEDIINETDFDLNKDIDLCIKADADGAKLSKGITVVFDKSLSEWTGIIDKVKIVLDGANHSVSADSRAIDDMIEADVCSVRIKCDNNKYTIVFIDENGKEVKNCPAKLTFALESDNEYNVVYYERNGKKENWSGQYNSADSTLEFMTSISGVYYVEENDLEITDISDLPDEQQRAIRFMVSRGYFTLTDSKFNPYGLLSRNDFTKALVSIFYELDYEAKSTFADVSEDDSYYSYIASSQSAEIVKGFEDNTFRGTQNTTKEEVVSIASRTIAEQKGYTYPENTDEYIVFADSDDITYWDGQKGEIALAVREGLIEKGGNFAPKADITRVEAALILYRLFNILYGVTPAGAEDGSFPIIPVAAGGAAVLACGGAGAFFLIKKRRKLI